MPASKDWQHELKFMVQFMRQLSQQTDPHEAAALYGRGLRDGGLIPTDGYLSVSRRDLKAPYYRITRSTTWKEVINPWEEKQRLPLFDRGLLSRLMYSNEPAIIEDLPSHYSPDDPAAEYFHGMKMMVTLPHFDDGEALNMGVLMARSTDTILRENIPMMLMQANLWGRAVLSSVLRQELKKTVDALDHEMKVVGEIQRALLPKAIPCIEGLDLAAYYDASQRAGGDYYDFLPLPDGRWGILIADVSGHGTPAAVMMAVTHAITHTRPIVAMPPGEFLAYLNRTLEGNYLGRTGSFVTAFYGIYDPKTLRFSFASAGHPQPRLLRAEKISGLDAAGGIPLGISDSIIFPERQIQLQRGDRLLFYTDGVSEAFNRARSQFGIEGLDAALARSSADAASLLSNVLADLQKHSGDIPAADDRTLLALCVR